MSSCKVNSLVEKMRIVANSKTASKLLLFGFFYIVAAASHCGFMEKWALRDGSGISLTDIVDGTASKPFVYRQLLPALAKTLQPVIAESNAIFFVKLRKYFEYNIDPNESFSKATSANIIGYEYTYRIVYLANFLSLLCSLFMLRRLLLNSGFASLEAILAPSAFILAFPYIQTYGGYFYDSLELTFFCGAVLLTNTGLLTGKVRLLALAFLVVFATLNKESFLFIIPTLYPFLRGQFSQKITYINLFILLIISALVNVYIKYIFYENTGGFVAVQILDNLTGYLTLSNYFHYETTYGLPSPTRMFILTLILIFIIFVRGWYNIAPVWKQHLKIAAVINIPLFIAFCSVGELRNLSITFVGFVILIAAKIKTTVATPQIK